MSSKKSHDKWYGNIGIDTDYERSLLKYRPNLIYPEKESVFPIPSEIVMEIRRSQDFTMSKTLIDYEELIEEIGKVLSDIEDSLSNDDLFEEYLKVLEGGKLKEVFKYEDKRNDYEGSSELDIYTILYLIKSSVEEQYDFLDENYRVKITDETEMEKVLESEMSLIDDWILEEYKILEMYEEAGHDIDNYDDYLYEIFKLEDERKRKKDFHRSIADVSYVHRNRYTMASHILKRAKEIIYYPKSLVGKDLDVLLENLITLPDVSSLSIHLLLEFKNKRERYENLREKFLFINSSKEMIASRRQLMYRDIVYNSNGNLKKWLEGEAEGYSESFDSLAGLLVHSVKNTEETYEKSLGDMLNIYQTEFDFYSNQMTHIREKEKIRQFARIVEDFEEAQVIDDDWINEYVKSRE